MVSAISSINKYPVNTESLEIIRRLQSLGVTPTGNISIDKQRLQKAELEKKQQTLASNSEQNLTRLDGTGNDFSSALNSVRNIQSQNTGNIGGAQNVQSIGLVDNVRDISSSNAMRQLQPAAAEENIPAERMIGATQLAELNKLKLGLIA